MPYEREGIKHSQKHGFAEISHFTLGICWGIRIIKEPPCKYLIPEGNSPVSVYLLSCRISELPSKPPPAPRAISAAWSPGAAEAVASFSAERPQDSEAAKAADCSGGGVCLTPLVEAIGLQ